MIDYKSTERIRKIKEDLKKMDEKLENEEEKCYYKCGEPLSSGYFCVIKEGKVVRAHKECHKRSVASGSNVRVIVR